MDSTAAQRARAWHSWQVRWTALATLPACLAVLFWGLVAVGWAGVLITVVVLVGHVGNQAPESRGTTASVLRSARPLVLLSITFAPGWAVLASLSAPAAIVVALVAAATSPPPVAWYRRMEGAGGPVPVRGTPVGAFTSTETLTALLAAPAQRMTDAQLCKAWRDSFTALRETRTPRETMMIVALRQSVMDALGARHPAGFQAWLESGPQASTGPEQFLQGA